ncbi:hypothetical protein FNH09_08175 [Streptomyces adustus]|uniref:HTH luxR-type domain-containing protein n=1 Tax=Streptomyces adustus TaxID=1609272 RepID=A0A5N8VB60_9ACTN|nr:hypothetical protein [Streptomyces adustus]
MRPELTAPEAALIRLVADGLTNQQVTRCLSIPPHTVSSHLWFALTKLNIASGVGLARLKAARERAGWPLRIARSRKKGSTAERCGRASAWGGSWLRPASAGRKGRK